MIDNTTKRDLSSTCGGHYEEYWYATHVLKTMAEEDFDKWFQTNCHQCIYMNEICMLE